MYGIIKNDGATYFPHKIVEGVLNRAPITTHPGFSTVWIGVDPASHFRSFMGLAAIGYHNGAAMLLGLKSASVAQCDVYGVQRIVREFIEDVEAHPFCQNPVVIPIIECNHSEVVALSILQVFKHACHATAMPWVKTNFDVGVSDGVGVFTTQTTKVRLA